MIDVLSNNAPKASLRDVMHAVIAEWPHLNRALLISGTRKRMISRPRQVAFLLSRELCGASLPRIAQFYGGRHHTTVLHGCRSIAALCEDGNLELEIAVNACRRRVMEAVAPESGEATDCRSRMLKQVLSGVTVRQLIEREKQAEREAA
jgi:hypothetical protein